MRTLAILALSLIPAAAQSPLVRIVNLSHPFSSEFQIGDRFEIRITGAPASRSASGRPGRDGPIGVPLLPRRTATADGRLLGSSRKPTSEAGAKSGPSGANSLRQPFSLT